MTQRIIEVVVSPQGETTVQTKGYAGADCLAASAFLERSLGVAIRAAVHSGVVPGDSPCGVDTASTVHANGRWSAADPRMPASE